MNLKMLVLLVVGLRCWTAATPVESLTFRADPFGNPNLTTQIVGFDPGPGSLLALDAVPVLASGGGDYTIVAQSRTDILPNTALPGLGTSYQILTLLHTRVKSVQLGPGIESLTNPTSAGPNLVEWRYHDLTVPLDEQTGMGFHTPSDPAILRGHVLDFSGVTILSDPTSSPLNQTGVASSDMVETLGLTGLYDLEVAVDFADPRFFPNPSEQPQALHITALLNTPFTQVLPNMGPFFTGIARNVGHTNGQGGPDIEFETDLTITLQAQTPVVVPEPTSLSFLLLGLGGLGVVRRRHRLP